MITFECGDLDLMGWNIACAPRQESTLVPLNQADSLKYGISWDYILTLYCRRLLIDNVRHLKLNGFFMVKFADWNTGVYVPHVCSAIQPSTSDPI